MDTKLQQGYKPFSCSSFLRCLQDHPGSDKIYERRINQVKATVHNRFIYQTIYNGIRYFSYAKWTTLLWLLVMNLLQKQFIESLVPNFSFLLKQVLLSHILVWLIFTKVLISINKQNILQLLFLTILIGSLLLMVEMILSRVLLRTTLMLLCKRIIFLSSLLLLTIQLKAVPLTKISRRRWVSAIAPYLVSWCMPTLIIVLIFDILFLASTSSAPTNLNCTFTFWRVMSFISSGQSIGSSVTLVMLLPTILVLILVVSRMNPYPFLMAILFYLIILLDVIQSVLLMQPIQMIYVNDLQLRAMLLCLLVELLLGIPRLSLLLLLVLPKLNYMLLFLLPRSVSFFVMSSTT